MVLVQGDSSRCGQGVKWDSSHCQTWWELKVPLPSTLIWLLSGLSFLKVIGLRTLVLHHSSEPLHWASYNWQLDYLSTSDAREREKPQGRSHSLFNNPVLEVTSHHICQILFTRSKSVSSAHTYGEEIPQGHEYWVRNHCKSSNSQPITFSIFPNWVETTINCSVFPYHLPSIWHSKHWRKEEEREEKEKVRAIEVKL